MSHKMKMSDYFYIRKTLFFWVFPISNFILYHLYVYTNINTFFPDSSLFLFTISNTFFQSLLSAFSSSFTALNAALVFPWFPFLGLFKIKNLLHRSFLLTFQLLHCFGKLFIWCHHSTFFFYVFASCQLVFHSYLPLLFKIQLKHLHHVSFFDCHAFTLASQELYTKKHFNFVEFTMSNREPTWKKVWWCLFQDIRCFCIFIVFIFFCFPSFLNPMLSSHCSPCLPPYPPKHLWLRVSSFLPYASAGVWKSVSQSISTGLSSPRPVNPEIQATATIECSRPRCPLARHDTVTNPSSSCFVDFSWIRLSRFCWASLGQEPLVCPVAWQCPHVWDRISGQIVFPSRSRG